jgi:DNA repair protein RecO (recombination protein O)
MPRLFEEGESGGAGGMEEGGPATMDAVGVREHGLLSAMPGPAPFAPSLTAPAQARDTPFVAERNLVYQCLVLRAKEAPSGSRILSLMTAEVGLLDVFVFGGPKSKLRSVASPYSAGRAFVYYDPVRDFYKLSDFEVVEAFSGLREGLRKLMGAGFVAEFLQKTSGGGGDFPEVLGLSLEALRGLEAAPEEKADYPALLFIWRMLGILGLMADPETCAACGAPLECDSSCLYSSHAGGFLCARCAESEAFSSREGQVFEAWPLTGGAHRWLARSGPLPFSEVLGATLSPASLDGLKALLYHLAARAAEGPLASLKPGMGLL